MDALILLVAVLQIDEYRIVAVDPLLRRRQLHIVAIGDGQPLVIVLRHRHLMALELQIRRVAEPPDGKPLAHDGGALAEGGDVLRIRQ